MLRRAVQREVDRLAERRRIEGDIGNDIENPAARVGVAGRVANIAPTFDAHPQRDVVDDEVAQLFAAVGVWQITGAGVPLLRHRDIDGNGRGRRNLAAGVAIRRHRGISHRRDVDRIGAVELRDGIGQPVPAGVADGVPDGKTGIGVAVGGALHIDVRGVGCRQLVPAAVGRQRRGQRHVAEIQGKGLARQIGGIDPHREQGFVGVAVLCHDREIDLRPRVFGGRCLRDQYRLG